MKPDIEKLDRIATNVEKEDCNHLERAILISRLAGSLELDLAFSKRNVESSHMGYVRTAIYNVIQGLRK
jgi:hypothetical protein